jgi:hypothetical protein
MFKVLNGPTYSEDDRPPLWHNEKALMVIRIDDCDNINVEQTLRADFQLIEDFEVWLEFISDAPDFGYHPQFYSASRGYIAGFPWWDHMEYKLTQDDFVIPLGNFRLAFHDIEQGWDIHIAAKDEFVYVIEGTWDGSDAYHRWFKVRQDLYLAEWEKAIQACKDAFLNKA